MLIENRFLFPLNEIVNGNGIYFYQGLASGYYMDVNGAIYSTRRGKGLVQLNGSRTVSGHYYTIGGTSYRHDKLFEAAKKSKTWAAHVGGGLVEPMIGTRGSEKRSYAPNLPSAIKQHAVMIASVTPDGYKLIIGSNPKFHLGEDSWRSEMQRLASLKPGTKFIALEIKAAIIAGGVVWEE